MYLVFASKYLKLYIPKITKDNLAKKPDKSAYRKSNVSLTN